MDERRYVQFSGLTPYLFYGEPETALTWLVETLGFWEEVRYLGPDGAVEEAEIRVGPDRVMIGGRAPEAGEGQGQLLVVHVDDVDLHHGLVRAAGVSAEAPRDRPYGARTYTVSDPWGYRWTFWQEKGEVRLEDGWTAVRS